MVVAFTEMRPGSTPSRLGQAGDHRGGVRGDLRAFADQGDVGVGQHAAARGDPPGGVAQEAGAVGVLPGGLAGREMAADIALGQRAVDRVAQRVDADIGVGMAGQAACRAAPRRRTASACGPSAAHARRSRCRRAGIRVPARMRSSRARSSG